MLFRSHGQSFADSAYSAGVVGVSSDSGVGTSNGVLGVALLPTATAGAFLSLPGSGSGRLISGLKGSGVDVNNLPITPFTEVFNVQPTGDVVSKTGDFQALAAGKGLILKSPDGNTCARLSIANGTGALVSTVVTCPLP